MIKIGDIIALHNQQARVIGLDEHHITVLVAGKKTTYPLKKEQQNVVPK